MRHVVVAATVAGVFAGCAAHGPIGVVTDLQVQGYETNSPVCASFHPSKRDVSAFFAKAIVVSGQTLHEHYEIYPCSAHGTLAAGHSIWSWTLRAGGTALVKPAGGQTLVLADPSQETSPADR